MVTTMSPDDFNFSRHALIRMQQRRISKEQVQAVLRFGSVHSAPGVRIYVFGKIEFQTLAHLPDVTPALRGLHVICSESGRVVTCYRRRRRRNHPIR